MDEQELRPKRALPHEIGQDLSLLSIAEIEERIGALRAEIMRLETAKAQKIAAQGKAESVFKRYGGAPPRLSPNRDVRNAHHRNDLACIRRGPEGASPGAGTASRRGSVLIDF